MLRLSYFYGIAIYMYYRDHSPPHFHAIYGSDEAEVAIRSRSNNEAAVYLYKVWLPQSGETLENFPIIFHYVNVGPNIIEAEMITDVYLPLK